MVNECQWMSILVYDGLGWLKQVYLWFTIDSIQWWIITGICENNQQQNTRKKIPTNQKTYIKKGAATRVGIMDQVHCPINQEATGCRSLRWSILTTWSPRWTAVAWSIRGDHRRAPRWQVNGGGIWLRPGRPCWDVNDYPAFLDGWEMLEWSSTPWHPYVRLLQPLMLTSFFWVVGLPNLYQGRRPLSTIPSAAKSSHVIH